MCPAFLFFVGGVLSIDFFRSKGFLGTKSGDKTADNAIIMVHWRELLISGGFLSGRIFEVWTLFCFCPLPPVEVSFHRHP